MARPVVARAPNAPGRSGSTAGHRLARLGLASVVLAAGLSLPARAAVVPTAAASLDPGPTTAPAVDTDREREARSRARTAGHVTRPLPLVPAPPPDGRDAPDPFVLADGDRYLLYSTQVGFHNVPVATSPDLSNWSPPADALPQLPAWAVWGRTWAPGVVRLGNQYLLYFAALDSRSGRQCIGVAASKSADGPFAAAATEPLVCQTELGGSIDPHPFVDDDGTAYLLWKADGNAVGLASTLFAQTLRPDGLALTGQAAALLSSGAPWEEPLIENPALVATGGSYALLYSGGWWESRGYAVGYATCGSPLGPCTKVTVDAPLVATGHGEDGPGGACVVSGPAHEQWLAYHAWTGGTVGYDQGGARSLHFAALTWQDGRPIVTR
jgi:beta-xylosidase